MKGAVKIKLSVGNEIFNISLDRKISFLKGDSGIGKTVFFNTLKFYYSREKQGISSDIKLEIEGCGGILLPSLIGEEWRKKVQDSKNCVVVIDESDVDVLKSKDLGRVVKNSGNYFLFIYRKNPLVVLDEEDDEDLVLDNGSITHSTKGDITFEFKKLGGCFVNSSKPLYSTINIKVNPDMVVTEDAQSSLRFLKNTLKCACDTSYGIGGVTKKVRSIVDEGIYKNIYVFADGENFAYDYFELYQYLRTNDFKKSGAVVNIADIRSFEYMLLSTGKIW